MKSNYNKLLILGAVLSALAVLLHIGCIIFGAPWYRVFGAGEDMAQMAEAGSNQPALITFIVAVILGVWSLYALAGAGVIRRLPLLRTALCLITAVYLIRGVAALPFMYQLSENSPLFWLVSSGICLFFGVVHLIGLRQVWQKLK
ncbi:hypothetical protein GCM10011613_12450 [Cellvibrio zantedeschiae]|uniref:DUF3995 domain-containing protein n=1 Tax=Cellvibrio zantedeschiae TaxID=1237077 RepID=A0ABQ3B033_9GAMM|nr:hypothetical protein [Cellvibrio zantedeschiae]GGY69615.1 hypothetical protein GCM10011613_12450 [Cellvibrio zantedeschiae]